ncbi:MAG: POTRA domain-containing protein, partial [Muribaculaceae bacterium]
MAAALGACSSTKHVPDDKYLLDKVTITVEDSDKISTDELYYFLRQQPNHKVLGFAKLQLATYSLSGRDSTKWYNKWLRRIGQAPVIYSPELTESSRRQLHQALINRGYLDATIEVDTIVEKPKRLAVDYRITTGRPHVISTIDYDIADTVIRDVLRADSALLSVSPGDIFDRNVLDNERGRITETLRNHGYYAFNKDNISFLADTVMGSKDIGL